jgi:hypothetical protein
MQKIILPCRMSGGSFVVEMNASTTEGECHARMVIVKATKELIAGFWLWQVASMDEAVAWVKRCPNPMVSDSDIEIRPVFEADDFGEEFTPELRQQEDRLRAQIRDGGAAP